MDENEERGNERIAEWEKMKVEVERPCSADFKLCVQLKHALE